MRLHHFQTLKPICPACGARGQVHPLSLIDPHMREGTVQAGLLACPSPDCGATYPILHGVPILVADLSTWLTANLHLLLQGDVDHAGVDALLARALGPDTAFAMIRQQAASYGYDHYGDLDPASSHEDAPPGGVRGVAAHLLALLPCARGPALDLGCAAGRTSFDLADKTGDLVLGIDLNWPLLKIGRGVIDQGLACYPHRRIGNRYEPRVLAAPLDPGERVDFWVADALNLPFAAGTFGLAAALNLLDCVVSPGGAVREADRVLAIGGGLILATPFDWAPHATPAHAWQEEGGLPALVDAAFAPVPCPLTAVATPLDLAWRLRLHERSHMHYRCQGMAFTKGHHTG